MSEISCSLRQMNLSITTLIILISSITFLIYNLNISSYELDSSLVSIPSSPITSTSNRMSSTVVPTSLPRLHAATKIMRAFAQRSGLELDTVAPQAAERAFEAAAATSSTPTQPRRYLWTDAFAVCNFLGLYRSTGEVRYKHLAQRTIQHVHDTLGKSRHDEPTPKSWLQTPHGPASEEHPTKAGLRIGKPLPERGQHEPIRSAHQQQLEWERDGQYFHYLTKWGHALDQASRVTGATHFNLWARELMDVAHRTFVYTTKSGVKRMRWKMSIDLSRPLVESMGQHDPLDGLITAMQLKYTAKQLKYEEGPNLSAAINDYREMVADQNFETTDALGLGGLLMDAYRLHQMLIQREGGVGGLDLLTRILTDALVGLRQYAAQHELRGSAESRLAFREFGLSIGLAAIEAMLQDRANLEAGLIHILTQIHSFYPLREKIESFWLDETNQRSESWKGHEDINSIMLCTSLAPEGFLDIITLGEKAGVKVEQPATFASVSRMPASPVEEVRRASIPINLDEATDPKNFETQQTITSTAGGKSQPAWMRTILNSVGDARVVMIGEATHGTEEFYRIRCLLTKQLIESGNCDFVAVEGDHPDIYRLNRYVQCQSSDKSAAEAMEDLKRFPTWMWRNEAVREFIEWLRSYNRAKMDEFNRTTLADFRRRQSAAEQKHDEPLPEPKMAPLVGFYGMDLYSLFTSASEVLKYLREHNPAAAKRAQQNYSTLERFREEASEYGIAVAYGLIESQQKQVVSVLRDLVVRGQEYVKQQGLTDGDELVYTKLNAKVVADAERYYAATLAGGQDRSWNVRDAHMVDTLLLLLQVYSDRKRESLGRVPKDTAADRAFQTEEKQIVAQVLSTSRLTRDQAKAAVWAHNSHLGDARATTRARIKEWNVGQLIREKLGLAASYNIGFSTYDGTVSAATSWGGRRQTMSVNPALPNSYELLFHQAATLPNQSPQPNYLIMLRSNTPTTDISANALKVLDTSRYQRAIGVQYVKATEFQSHYFQTKLTKQFDSLIHLDRTHALEPLLDVRTELREEARAEDAGAKPIPMTDSDFEEDEAAGIAEEVAS